MQSSSSKTGLFTRAELRARGYALLDPPLAILAYDPAADGDDHDGLAIVSREEHRCGELHDPDMSVEIIYRILMTQYMPRDLEFPDKMAKIIALDRSMTGWRNSGKMAGHFLLVESNGVGWSAGSFLRTKLGKRVRSYTTTSSVTGSQSGEPWASSMLAMPRLAALDHLRMQLDLQRLKSEENAPGSRDFVNELNSFIWVSKNRPEAIKGQHDDLIMPTAACCWFGSKVIPPLVKATPVTPDGISGRSAHTNLRTRMI